MRRLGFLPLVSALVALPACIIEHGLGETAEDSGNSGQSSSDTSGGPSTSSDPSGDDPTTGEDPPGGGNLLCDPHTDSVIWVSDLTLTPGLDPSFLALLDGPCTAGEAILVDAGDYSLWELPLECSLGGRLDDDVDFSGDFSLTILLYGSVPGSELFGSVQGPLQLRMMLDWRGMGWNSWLVLEREEDGAPVLDLTFAEYLDPIDSAWGQEVSDRLGGEPWHGGLSMVAQETECGGDGTECNDQPMAVSVGWGAVASLLLQPFQEGTVGTDIEELQIRTSLTESHATPMPACLDHPQGGYHVVSWAVEP